MLKKIIKSLNFPISIHRLNYKIIYIYIYIIVIVIVFKCTCAYAWDYTLILLSGCINF